MMAGTLEILFTDLFRQLFNRHPKAALKYLNDPSIKQVIPLWKIEINELERHDFDLRNKLGDYIFSGRRIDSIQFLQKSCQILFGETVDDPNGRIRWLFQARHVVAHLRGVPDERYFAQTGLPPTEGKIQVKPQEIEDVLQASMNLAVSLGILLSRAPAQSS